MKTPSPKYTCNSTLLILTFIVYLGEGAEGGWGSPIQFLHCVNAILALGE